MNLEEIFGRRFTKSEEIFLYSGIASAIVILLGLVLSQIFKNINIILNFSVFAVFVAIIPFFIYKYLRFLELKSCEEYLTVFLNDLKETKKSGLSFPDSIKSCKGEYGKLNKYVEKLKQDMSWGVSIDDSLKYMQKSLGESDMISKSLSILMETYRSGGNIEDILEALINSLLKIAESEAYKKSIMQQHMYMMYVIFLMFIGLVIVLGNFLIPMLTEIGSQEGSISGISLISANSPCLIYANSATCSQNIMSCGVCSYYNVIGGMFGFGEPYSVTVYYKSLFLTMILVQGSFTGLIAGQISNKSWIDGIKHGLIMFFIGFFIVIMTSLLGLF